MQQLVSNKTCFSSFPLLPWHIMLAHLAQEKGVIYLLTEWSMTGWDLGRVPLFTSVFVVWASCVPLYSRGRKIAPCASSLGLSPWEKKIFPLFSFNRALQKRFSKCAVLCIWGSVGLMHWSWGYVLAQAGSLVSAELFSSSWFHLDPEGHCNLVFLWAISLSLSPSCSFCFTEYSQINLTKPWK